MYDYYYSPKQAGDQLKNNSLNFKNAQTNTHLQRRESKRD